MVAFFQVNYVIALLQSIYMVKGQNPSQYFHYNRKNQLIICNMKIVTWQYNSTLKSPPTPDEVDRYTSQ